MRSDKIRKYLGTRGVGSRPHSPYRPSTIHDLSSSPPTLYYGHTYIQFQLDNISNFNYHVYELKATSGYMSRVIQCPNCCFCLDNS